MFDPRYLTISILHKFVFKIIHKHISNEKTNFPPNILASHPPGNWLKAYPQKKDDCTKPAVDAFHPN